MRIVAIGLRGVPGIIGGVEAHCERLYPLLAEMDPSLHITVMMRHRSFKIAHGTFRGVRTTRLYAPQTSGVEAAIHTALALLYARFVLKPDLVHIHGIGPGFFTLLAKWLGLRTIVTHHAEDFERPKWGPVGRWFLRTGESIAVRHAETVICVSEALRDSVVARHPAAAERIVTIRNGGPSDRVEPAEDSDILERLNIVPRSYVFAAGRLEATKAFHDLVEAFERAAPPGRILVIAGSGAPGDRYAASLQERASDRVRFVGHQTGADLARLFREAALFVHPSQMEGFGLVVSEALTAHVPVAVSDIPAHREFALPERCYFPPGDVEALAALLRTADYGTFLAPAAASEQAMNTWEDNARRHLAVIRGRVSVLAGDGRAGNGERLKAGTGDRREPNTPHRPLH